MTSLWRWEGLFTVEVPEDWKVRDLDNLVELEPLGRAGSAHISPMRRSPESTERDGDAVRAALEFAGTRRAVGLECEPERRVGEHASARCVYATDEDGFRLWWDVVVHVCPVRGPWAWWCPFLREGRCERWPSRSTAADGGSRTPTCRSRSSRLGVTRSPCPASVLPGHSHPQSADGAFAIDLLVITFPIAILLNLALTGAPSSVVVLCVISVVHFGIGRVLYAMRLPWLPRRSEGR